MGWMDRCDLCGRTWESCNCRSLDTPSEKLQDELEPINDCPAKAMNFVHRHAGPVIEPETKCSCKHCKPESNWLDNKSAFA